MAIQQIRNQVDLTGLSTDTKPTKFGGEDIGAGSTFWESDTDNAYKYDGNSWYKTSISGAAKTILFDSDGNEVTSFGSTGLSGTQVTQVTVTASTTASVVLTFSQPLKGVRMTAVNVTPDAAVDGYFNICFGPPSDLIAADWLDETLSGPRVRVTTKQAVEIPFLDPITGDPITIATWAHKASHIDTDFKLVVEGYV